MSKRLTRKRRRLTKQAGDLLVATPLVMGARLSRMAKAGASPSARDQREFAVMGTEKLTVFTESWSAMALQAMRLNQALLKAWWTPWQRRSGGTATTATWTSTARRFEAAALDTANKGIAPIRRRTVGNARRLNRRPSSRR